MNTDRQTNAERWGARENNAQVEKDGKREMH